MEDLRLIYFKVCSSMQATTNKGPPMKLLEMCEIILSWFEVQQTNRKKRDNISKNK
jgi:hypothetical protein